MQTIDFDTIAALAADPDNGWSIGSFGSIGEFMRDRDEEADIHRQGDRIEILTRRGGMRIVRPEDSRAVAWDSLSGDGESWGHGLAICVAIPPAWPRTIRALGPDHDAMRPAERSHQLFSLGVGHGAVDMALRTDDPGLIAAMRAAEGGVFPGDGKLMPHVLRAQPHRVVMSPLGRIEIFQPVPPPDGTSPQGPHTHVLPQHIARNRPHSANIPIPEGSQSALSLHPRSPWRTTLGERHAYRPDIDAAFAPLLDRFGLEEDHEVDRRIRESIARQADPDAADWPDTRRGRTRARILLRRMAASGDARVAPWRAMFDRAPLPDPDDES